MRRLPLIACLLMLAAACGSSPAPLALTAPAVPDGYASEPYSLALHVEGGQTPYQFAVHGGALPDGVTLDGEHGVIAGTPTQAGTGSAQIAVTDAAGSSQTVSVSWRIWAALALAPASLPDGAVGQAYDVALQAAGGKAPLALAVTSGSLSGGLSLADGHISGTPTDAGPRSFEITVNDANGHARAVSFLLQIRSGIHVDAVSPADAYVGKSYSVAFTAQDATAPLTWQVAQGSLPGGLSLGSNGTLQGSATEEGDFPVSVSVTDAANRTASLAVTLHVYRVPALDTLVLPDGYLQASYSETLSASGGKAPLHLVIVTGVLPTGLQLNGMTISGTPTESVTNRSITFKVEDANFKSSQKTLAITVHDGVFITTTSLPDGYEGTAYSASLSSAGGAAPVTWSVYSGSLPAGVALSSSGVLSGTPTAQGPSTFTIRAQDSAGTHFDKALTLDVHATGTPTIVKVGSWNTEWFGDPSLGPSDDALQEQNVASVISHADLDLWGLAELVDQTEFDTLLSDLPDYSGFMANDPGVTSGSSYYSTNEQKVGVIYKSSEFTVTGATLIDTYCNSDFAGRPPMEVDLTYVGSGLNVPVKLIVLHAKAYDDITSYDHRLSAAGCLKSYLDSLPAGPVLVVGDWNDDVDQSITGYAAGSCTEAGSSGHCETPYLNLVNDPADYTFLTAPLSASGVHSTVDFPDMIDHHLATSEMATLHVAGSTQVLRPDLSTWNPAIPSYGSTTSDHYPVESDFNFGAPPPPPQVFINEVRYTQLNDVNGNPDYNTEFVEVVNGGAGSVDLSGWQLSDSQQVRHTFAAGTTLGAGKAIVVFGGPPPVGIANAVASTTGSLSLHPADSVTLSDSSGTIEDSHSWSSDFSTPGMSANRATDGDPAAVFVAHDQVSSAIASPGTRADGSPF